jgi:hypothetical protein
VFENRVLGIIFRSEREEVIAGWRKLYSEELYSSQPSPNMIRVIKSRKMR